MKKKFLGLAASALLVGSMAAHATPIQIDFNVSGGWFDTGTPYNMPLSPNLSGTALVDDAIAGPGALLSFSMVTGAKTWTKGDIIGANTSPFTQFIFVFGSLLQFSVQDLTNNFFLSSNNTFSVFDPAKNQFNACNNCVTFTTHAFTVPEPGALALFGLGILALSSRRVFSPTGDPR